MCITKANLEEFLELHKRIALPEWFPTGSYKDYQSIDYRDGVVLVTPNSSIHGFTILPYLRGKLAYVKQADIVISYPFSGCCMARFSYTTDSPGTYVAHIARGDGGVSEELFQYFCRETSFTNKHLFDPHYDCLTLKCDLGKIKKTQCYGIITSDNNPYTIILGQSSQDDQWYILAWKKTSFNVV